MGQNSLYVIGIGGTGAKCIEAIAQIASVGLLTDNKVKFLFVDADENNGNLERARKSLSIYQRTHRLISNRWHNFSWLQTPIISYIPDVWSPFAKTNTNKDLASFFSHNLQQNPDDLSNLFDVLYTEEERNASLDVGFRGRPAIGSAVMSHLDLDSLEDDPWTSFMGDILADCGSGSPPRIFLCGSIFGGLGAAGLSILGRLIYINLERYSIKQYAKISCLFVLPYFRFPKPTEKDAANQEVYACSEQFILNAKSALRYYVNQNQCFHTIYLLGNQNLSNYKFSIGKNTQRNKPHFVELYSALAARHFLLDTSTKQDAVIIIRRHNSQQIIWNDLPDTTEVKSKLVNATRFAYAWLSNIVPELNTAKKIGVSSFQRNAPWFVKFYCRNQGLMGKWFNSSDEDLPDFNDPQQQQDIADITEWCQDYLRWLSDIHQCDGDDIQLFRYRAFANLGEKLQGEYLADLVVGDNRDQEVKNQDTLKKLKQKLKSKNLNLSFSDKGTVGLAKTLYLLCRL